MEFKQQFLRLRAMIQNSRNPNLVKDFFVQYAYCRTLYTDIIIRYIDGDSIETPGWVNNVRKVDIRNTVVFLMWKEHQTVIDAKENVYDSESTLGERIEDLGVYLETMYCLRQIDYIDSMQPWSYTEWVKYLVDTNGLVYTIEQLMSLLLSTVE